MKKSNQIIWGILLIAAGVLIALNALDLMEINVFFDGWWTLFIIVPCAVGLFTEREKTGNIVGIAVGVLLLLCCREVVSFSLFRKLIVPSLIVFIGIRVLCRGLFGKKANALTAKQKEQGSSARTCSATFSGCDMNFNGEVFEGANLSATFGGVKCDLRGALIQKDCVIRATAVFGGIDILVPAGVNVKVDSIGIFGGTSNKTAVYQNAPTLYVNSTCMFGGVEIK